MPQVYDLSRSVAETRARTNATLQLSLTREPASGSNSSASAPLGAVEAKSEAEIYGNPVFDVRKGSEDSFSFFFLQSFMDLPAVHHILVEDGQLLFSSSAFGSGLTTVTSENSTCSLV